MFKRLIIAFYLLALLCFTVGAQNKMSTKEAARLTLNEIVKESAMGLTVNAEVMRTESLEVKGNSLVYDSVIPDFTTYQNYKNSTSEFKRSCLQTMTNNPKAGLLLSVLADLGMGLRYDFHSGARTSSFSVEILPSELIEASGGSIDREARIKIVLDYLDSVFPVEDADHSTHVIANANGICVVVPYETDSKSEDVSYGKQDAQYEVFQSIVTDDASSIFYYLSMYLDVPFITRLKYTDRTIEVSLSSSELYELYLEAMDYLIDQLESLENEDGVDYSDVEVVYADPNESDQEGRVGYDGIPMPFQLVEEKPTFMGGDANKFSEWVNANLVYPKIAKDN